LAQHWTPVEQLLGQRPAAVVQPDPAPAVPVDPQPAAPAPQDAIPAVDDTVEADEVDEADEDQVDEDTDEELPVPPLSGPEKFGAVVTTVLATGVSVLGLLSSFSALSRKAKVEWGYEYPWMLPVGLDLAIPGFTLARLFLIRLDQHVPTWLVWVPRLLTAATVALNWDATPNLWGRVSHAGLTLLWVVFSEIGCGVYANRINAVTKRRRMERVRRSRWFMAPVQTAAITRRMILWEITSYADALDRERERLLARAELREMYGRAWRFRAPLRDRVLMRLGELQPEAIRAGFAAADEVDATGQFRDGSGTNTPAWVLDMQAAHGAVTATPGSAVTATLNPSVTATTAAAQTATTAAAAPTVGGAVATTSGPAAATTTAAPRNGRRSVTRGAATARRGRRTGPPPRRDTGTANERAVEIITALWQQHGTAPGTDEIVKALKAARHPFTSRTYAKDRRAEVKGI
jgi:hypothetical protein